MSTEDNKGYKFRFEYATIDHYHNEDDPSDNEIRFVTFGDTPKETIEGYEALDKEYYEFLDRKAKRPYEDRHKLK